MKLNLNRKYFVDKIFWFISILYFDPGGFIRYYFNNNIISLIDFTDIYFLIMIACFFKIKITINFLLRSNKNLKKLIIFLVIWSIYIIFLYGLIIPNHNFSEFLFFLIKQRKSIQVFLLIIPIYYFAIRSIKIFVKYLIFSSFFILSLYFITILLNINIVPLDLGNRGWGFESIRYMMYNYGLIPIIIYLAIVVYLSKLKIKYKKYIYLSGIMMTIAWVISITRRHIVALFILIIIYNLIFMILNKSINFNKIVKSFLSLLICTAVLSSIFPEYINITSRALQETMNVLVEGQTSYGKVDQRLSFNKEFIVNIGNKNPFFGTGFDYRWQGAYGADEEGYETVDYPLLSTYAMYGIIGMIIFSYFYYFMLLIINNSFYLIRRIPKNKINILKYEYILSILFIGLLIYELIDFSQYFSHCLPQIHQQKIYFYIAILLGMNRSLLYKLNEKNV
tara:strand:- start:97 stop:1446 length:1350 start_codon:yes stop_codon:yes gene_type:complete